MSAFAHTPSLSQICDNYCQDSSRDTPCHQGCMDRLQTLRGNTFKDALRLECEEVARIAAHNSETNIQKEVYSDTLQMCLSGRREGFNYNKAGRCPLRDPGTMLLMFLIVGMVVLLVVLTKK